jgi:hypothetical protein
MTDPGEDIFLPPPRRWGPGGWAVAACAFIVAVGSYVGLLVWQPVACGLLTTHAGFAFVVSTVRNRNLAAELKAASERLAAFNGSESRDDLAALGPISPAAGTRPVDLYDQDADLAVGRENRRDVLGMPDRTGEVVAEFARLQAEHARTWSSCNTAHGQPDHLGQACGWWDGTTNCGDPAEGWTRWPDGEPVWLCGVHMAWAREQAEPLPDLDASDVRSLPEKRRT